MIWKSTKKIRTFDHILPSVPILIGGAKLINMENVINFTKLESKFNNIQGALIIPQITDQQEQIMLTEPIFIYKTFGEGLSDAYYLNYNPR